MTTTSPRPAARLDGRPTAERILEAATELFAERGFANTSIQNIADAVGILKGSLYYYIDSKDDLLVRLFRDTQAGALAIVEEVRARTDLDPLQRLRLYVERQVMYNAEHSSRTRTYYSELESLPDEASAEIRQGRKEFENFVIVLIDEARESGTVAADGDSYAQMLCVFAVTNWMHVWYRPGGSKKPAEMAAKFGDFVVNAIRS